MLPTHETFDFTSLTFDAAPKPTRSGGKMVWVSYASNQVQFQLGRSPKDTLRCPYGFEASREEPDRFHIKLELTPETKAFLVELERNTIAAAEENAMSWFKKSPPNATHNSCIKQQSVGRPDVVKLRVITEVKNATVVRLASWKNGKLTKPIQGKHEDIKPDSYVLPIVKIQGGVYFVSKTYGTSLVASAVLVVNEERSDPHLGNLEFDYGDVEMTDAEEESDDVSEASVCN